MRRVLGLIGPLVWIGIAGAQNSTLVSEAASGGVANDASERPAISADGRYVAFESDASDLVGGDLNGFRDVFVRDRYGKTTLIVSIDSNGVLANGSSERAALSADGRLVAFVSYATNLVATDNNGVGDIFVHDCQTGVTRLVSMSSVGAQANGASTHPALSGDGRYVAFASDAANLVQGDSNSLRDVFVHDLLTGATERVSVGSAGEEADGPSEWPGLSHDGRFVAFASLADNLWPGYAGYWDVFRRDRVLGQTQDSLAGVYPGSNGDRNFPSISADGTRVSYQSTASNLVSGDTNGHQDVFVYDYGANMVDRVSLTNGGGEANGPSFLSRISPDGGSVTFKSQATNLVVGDSNGAEDIFVRDTVGAGTSRVSIGDSGQQGTGDASRPAIAMAGQAVAFQSLASNLVAGDGNGASDVFAWTRPAQTWWVDAQAAGPGSGTQQDPFPRIQDAIDAPTTAAGDTVMVQPGSYVENVDFGGKPLDLIGVQGAAVTAIDGNATSSAVALAQGEGPVRLVGLTMTNGAAYQGLIQGSGGGIYCDGCSLVIDSCVIEGNGLGSAVTSMPSHGSGIYARNANIQILDSNIRNNWVGLCPTSGGGLHAEGSQVFVKDSTFRDHDVADYGGAIALFSSPAYFEGCSVTDTAYGSGGPVGKGVAIYAEGAGSTLELHDCDVERSGDWQNFSIGSGIYSDGVGLALEGCVFRENRCFGSPGGGAVYVRDASVSVDQCVFDRNYAESGGAVYAALASVSISNSLFTVNVNDGWGGGALALDAQVSHVIVDSIFQNNVASYDCYQAGAIYGGNLLVQRCSFIRNESVSGGAAVVGNSAFEDCEFIENRTTWCLCCGDGNGGAVVAMGNVSFLRCLFDRNEATGGNSGTRQGGAVYGPATLDRCTLVGNVAGQFDMYGGGGGGAVYDAALTNSIVWGSSPDQLNGLATASWSIVEGGWPGIGNIDADPLFWLPEVGDYFLQPGSPAIDAGNPLSPPDSDGSIADMGAYPFDPQHSPSGISNYCSNKTPSDGCQPLIAWSGGPTVNGADDFHVLAQSIPAQRAGLMFWGLSPVALPFKGGTLCVIPVTRTPIQFSGGTTWCAGQFDYFLSQSYMEAKAITAGTPVFAQYWFRDPGFPPPNDIGLTDGLGFVVQ